jgi:hypothetical protein
VRCGTEPSAAGTSDIRTRAAAQTRAATASQSSAIPPKGDTHAHHTHRTGLRRQHDSSELPVHPQRDGAGGRPLRFLASGFSEGRSAYAAIGQRIAGGFDAKYYLWHNPDVAAAGVDPLFHYNVVGWREGRDPNVCFDTDGYLSDYTDVAAAGINPLHHYEAVGWREGRDPSTSFDTLGYLARYPDVAAAQVNPLDHFLQFGIYEGRYGAG